MKTSARQIIWPASVGSLKLWVPAALLWLPIIALAQANACDQLKATLAARIEATGVRGYSLEVVPAATPAPAGAKAIGNCEGGARKVLYRRWGGASASAPEAIVAPAPPPQRPPPVARPNVAAPGASVLALAPASSPAPSPASAPAAIPAPANTPLARASAVDVVLEADAAITPAAQTLPPEPPSEKPPLSQRVSEFVTTNWRWLLALLLVPLSVLGWAWRAHHLAYDKNGLPRGPRL